MAETNISRKAQGAGKKLLGFGLLTILWLAASGYLVWHSKASMTGSECLSSIPCLDPNEWGDLLAGLFAPIAFLWLVATVWIQSDELRLQREELALTRLEMEHTREVLKEQAEESRKQAEFVGTQTDILKRSQIDEQLRAFLSVFQHWVLHNFNKMATVEQYQGLVRTDQGYLTSRTPVDPVGFFIEVCGRIDDALEDKENSPDKKIWGLFAEQTNHQRQHLPSYLQKVASYQGSVSPALEMVISTTNVRVLGDRLFEVMNA
ncbi:hypothetical protein [Agrobacterium sp. DE0009]|uniref:hypothetical protein n=1 Tax=Agrobacterium sp. DE0009 TaxID=2587505 RepID=UPI0011A73AC9|nr:hypothetical protein [Agrobacterium sp. DE0009]